MDRLNTDFQAFILLEKFVLQIAQLMQNTQSETTTTIDTILVDENSTARVP